MTLTLYTLEIPRAFQNNHKKMFMMNDQRSAMPSGRQ